MLTITMEWLWAELAKAPAGTFHLRDGMIRTEAHDECPICYVSNQIQGGVFLMSAAVSAMRALVDDRHLTLSETHVVYEVMNAADSLSHPMRPHLLAACHLTPV